MAVYLKKFFNNKLQQQSSMKHVKMCAENNVKFRPSLLDQPPNLNESLKLMANSKTQNVKAYE